MIQIKKEKLSAAIKKLKAIKVLVVGDAILDEYLFGEVTRISPEAPVPVVLIRNEKTTLGGAGNVIKNLSAIGVKTEFFAKSGTDSNSTVLINLLKNEGLSNEDIHIIQSKEIPTIIKSRIIATTQQICRIDREKIISLTKKEELQVLKKFTASLKSTQAVILSDYDKGFFSDKLISEMISNSVENQKIITVDPQVRHFFKYKNINLMTPNHHEAGLALGRKLITDRDIESAIFEIAKKLHSKSMMITRGDKGMSLLFEKKVHHIPTLAKEVFDVTGAGDTVISLYTAFRSAGLNDLESSMVANVGAGVVVEKLGASTVSLNELILNLEKRNLVL